MSTNTFTTAVISDDNTTITVSAEQGFLTIAGVDNTIQVAGQLQSLSNVDTDTNGLNNGSVLVYKTATGNWTATTTLEEQEITGGQY